MSSPEWELQRAIHDALASNATLTTLMGGPRIYDNVPRGAAYPYITFSSMLTRDWSTGTEEGREHLLTFNVWSQAKGAKEAQNILHAAIIALETTTLSLASHRLINLHFEAREVRRDVDGETFRGTTRLRAVTEPNS